MEINNHSSLNASLSTNQAKAVAQTWQVGQLLKAVVIETVQNNVKLRIDNALIQAPTTKQHQQGEVLLLSVLRTGDKPILKVLPPQLASSAALQTQQASALKVLLPKQAPLTPLLANLTAIAQLKTQIAAPLTAEISDGIKKLLDNIAHADKINDPAVLRRAINDAGLLLEKKLANPPLTNHKNSPLQTTSNSPQAANNSPTSSITQDFKGNLLQLLTVLRQSPTIHSADSKIPLPLHSTSTNPFTGSVTTPHQAQTPAQLTSQVIKENLLRLLSAPTGSVSNEAGKRTPQSSLLAELTTSISRLPLPFFRHLPLQAQKAQLPSLALLTHRDQIIDELIRQVEGSLARVQLSQLASLPQESSSPPSWTFELPLRHGETVDVIQFRIEKEDGEEDSDKAARWRVTLTLDLPEIGTIYATITIQGERASTILWAENDATAVLINDNLQLLHDALAQHGVKADEIRCQHGAPPAPPHQRRHTLLVDTQV